MSAVGGISGFEASISLHNLVLRRLQADPTVQAQPTEPKPESPPPAVSPPPESSGCSIDVYA